MNEQRGPFVVIGGGPCGLAAAWELSRRGHRPVVLEAEDRVGGLCATHERDGFRFDLGGHRFVSSSSELSRWLEELLGDDLLEQERRSVVLHAGRRFRYPLEARDLLATLGPRENAAALAGYLAARVDKQLHPGRYADRSFEDWVVARFGWPLYRAFFGPYTEKLWGRAPREISADWAAERISLLHLGDALVRLLGVPRPAVRTYARRYRYPRLGMGQLYETMARAVEAQGGVIHLGARVSGLETSGANGADGASGERVTAVLATRRDGSVLRVPVGELLSTMPLTDLARGLCADSPPAATERLRFRGLTFLNLGLSRAEVSDATWMYVADGAKRISRIQEPKRRSLAMAPPGKTSLMLEIPSDPGDDVWTAPDAELETRMKTELRALGLSVDDVETRFTVRVEHGYPVYHLEYQRDRAELLAHVARFTNVRTAGRQGLFRYVFMDVAMQMGRQAALEMVSGARPSGSLDALGRGRGVIETAAITA